MELGRGSNEPKVQIQLHFHLHFHLRAPISFWFIGAPIPFPFSFPSVKIWAPNEKGVPTLFLLFLEDICALGLENGDGNGNRTMNWVRRSNSICVFAQLLGISSNFQEFPSKTEMEMDVDFQWTGGWTCQDHPLIRTQEIGCELKSLTWLKSRRLNVNRAFYRPSFKRQALAWPCIQFILKKRFAHDISISEIGIRPTLWYVLC